MTENRITTDQFVKAAGYIYDAADNVVSLIDANGSNITNQYNRQGNLLRTTAPKDQTTTRQYDIQKNLLQMTTPGESTFIINMMA